MKQLVALTLSAAMAAGMLSGCGDMVLVQEDRRMRQRQQNGSGGGLNRGCRQRRDGGAGKGVTADGGALY